MDQSITEIIFLVMSLLLIAVLAEPVARRIKIPFSALLVILGFISSQILMAVDYPTTTLINEFHDLVFYVFLPILIFESAFAINCQLLFKNIAPILILALPIMLFSTLVTAILIYWGIDHATGFPWVAALITGALLSATDPVAVVALFNQGGAPERLAILIEGESLFNDATAIVVFSLALALALSPQQEITVSSAFLHFGIVFFGGLLIGIIVSFVALLLQRAVEEPVIHGLISIIAAYFAFLLAEKIFHISGVMAVLALGLILGRAYRSDYHEDNFIQRLWAFNVYISNALVFLLMGLIISMPMFQERWLAILIGIASVLVVRLLGLFLLFPLTTHFTPEEPIDIRYRAVLFWGGLRGAVTLALALSIPTQLDYWWTIQSIAFGVVLFTLFIQAPSMNLLLKKLGLLQTSV